MLGGAVEVFDYNDWAIIDGCAFIVGRDYFVKVKFTEDDWGEDGGDMNLAGDVKNAWPMPVGLLPLLANRLNDMWLKSLARTSTTTVPTSLPWRTNCYTRRCKRLQ